MSYAGNSFLTSTIGRKYLVALTAIFWCGFVMIHMIGNMLIFAGAEAYNKYSFALISNPFIYIAEVVLVTLLLVHAVSALGLACRNWRTKPRMYAVRAAGPKAAPVSSRTMAYTGSLILAFIIWHLITFKYGPHYSVVYNGIEMRDLYRLIQERFHEPLYMVGYCFVMILVGMHLFHGVKSIFQTLGFNHPRYNHMFRYFGYVYAIVVAAGFFAQPLYVYFAG